MRFAIALVVSTMLAFAVGDVFGGEVDDTGLVGQWALNGDAVDASPGGHDGTIHGAMGEPDRFGTPAHALGFDGSSRVDVPDSDAFNLGSEPFTMGAWVRMDAFGGDGGYYLMGHSTGPGNTSKWIFWLGNGGISFIIGPNGGWHGLGSFPFELDTWYHVAVRRDAAGTLAAFVDGQQIGSQAIGSLVIGNPNHALQIGTAESDRPRRPMRGTVDGVRIYKRALSDAEIETLAADEPGVLDCMAGNVDAANDRVADVLFVDGSSGGGSRRVAVESGGGFEVSLEAPPSGPDSARYAVFGWLAEPSQASSLRGGGAIVGCTVNPTPLHIGSTPQPVFCAAGDGVPPSVCGGDAPGPAYAPWNVVRMRGGSASITLQAVVQDAGASNGSGFSVTNAVIIDIR